MSIPSSSGLSLTKLVEISKILDANECKSTMYFNPVRPFVFTSIRRAAKVLRISRKRARWMELNGRLVISI